MPCFVILYFNLQKYIYFKSSLNKLFLLFKSIKHIRRMVCEVFSIIFSGLIWNASDSRYYSRSFVIFIMRLELDMININIISILLFKWNIFSKTTIVVFIYILQIIEINKGDIYVENKYFTRVFNSNIIVS